MLTHALHHFGPALQAAHDLPGGGRATTLGEEDPTGAPAMGIHQPQLDQFGHRFGDVVLRRDHLSGNRLDGDPLHRDPTDGQTHHHAQTEVGERDRCMRAP